MELGLPLLDPEGGLLGSGLELFAYPPEVLVGLAIGVEGLDLIDPFVEVGAESLNILFGGGNAFLRRQLLRRRSLFSLHLRGLHLRAFVARPSLGFGRVGKISRVELKTEDLLIGGSAVLGGRLLPRLLPFGLHLRPFVALRPSSVFLLRTP